MSKINTASISLVWSWLQWRTNNIKFWLCGSVENHRKAFTTKMYYYLENWHSGNFDRRMTLIYIPKKFLQFLLNFGNGVNSCCTWQSIKWRRISLTLKTASIGDFPSNISAAYAIAKRRQLGHIQKVRSLKIPEF